MKREIEYHDVSTANLEEKRVLKILEYARKSENLKHIIQKVKQVAQLSTSISICASRVKRPESLLRTIRVKGLENACDLAGVLFVVEENKDIYMMANQLNDLFQNAEHYDLSKSLGVPPYKTVPLCYTILTQLYLDDVDVTVPFEIRIHDKVGILATESNYYLYKKDGISDVKERFELSGKMLDVIRLRAEIDSLKNKDDDKTNINNGLIRNSLVKNKDLFSNYLDDIYNVFKEYTRNLFRYNNKLRVGHFEFIDGKILNEQESNSLDEKLNHFFDLYYQRANVEFCEDDIINFYLRCCYAIERIKMIDISKFTDAFGQSGLNCHDEFGIPVEHGMFIKKNNFV